MPLRLLDILAFSKDLCSLGADIITTWPLMALATASRMFGQARPTARLVSFGPIGLRLGVFSLRMWQKLHRARAAKGIIP